MVRWMRKALVAPGKFIEAVGFATEIAGYVKKFEGLPPVHVFIDSFGDITTLRWIVDYESLAAMEQVSTHMTLKKWPLFGLIDCLFYRKKDAFRGKDNLLQVQWLAFS